MKNLLSLLDGALADERAALAATDFDIERAAVFSSENYMNAPGHEKLENTMAIATQSLGTVAFHISKLADQFIGAMTLQSDIIAEIATEMEQLRMVYNIYQEKVARKSIGSCTKTKVPIVFHHGLVHPEPPQRYLRHPIDYSVLDSTGHGVRLQEPVPTHYSVSVAPDAFGQLTGSNFHNHNYVGRQSSIASIRSMEHSAGSICSGGSVRYQSGSIGRTAGLNRVPQNLSNAHHQHTGEDGLSSVAAQVSPLSANTSVRYINTPHIQGPPDTGATAFDHLERSSGSPNVASNVHLSGHYATNQQIHHVYTPPQGFNNLPQMTRSHVPLNKAMGSLPEHSHQPQEKSVTQYASTHPLSTVSQVFQSSGSEHTITPQHYAQQRPVLHQHGLIRGASMQVDHNNDMQNALSMQVNSTHSYTPATALDNADHIPLPPPEAYAETFQKPGALMCDLSSAETVPVLKGMLTRKPNDPSWVPPIYMEKVVTLYEYECDKEDELTFKANQTIYVVRKNADGWWEGIMDGVTGLFPSNYVEVVESNSFS